MQSLNSEIENEISVLEKPKERKKPSDKHNRIPRGASMGRQRSKHDSSKRFYNDSNIFSATEAIDCSVEGTGQILPTGKRGGKKKGNNRGLVRVPTNQSRHASKQGRDLNNSKRSRREKF